MISSITVADLQQSANYRQLVDVRSATEFATGHIPGALNIPLDQIESRVNDLRSDSPIVLVCQMGKRARMAATLLDSCKLSLTVLEGGTNAWIQSGLPVVINAKTRWSLERQVRLAAGFLVLLGAALALTVSAQWVFLCAFVGLGLAFAGLTDICPMAELLIRLPWNKTSHCRVDRADMSVRADSQ